MLSDMSSVPISKAYVSKYSNALKKNPRCTSAHSQVEENLNPSSLQLQETQKYLYCSEHFWSDCKVSVAWDDSAIRLIVETKK